MKQHRWHAILALLLLSGVAASGQPALYVGPYLQNVSANSAVVRWETTEPVQGTVAYWLQPDAPKSVVEAQPATLHELKVEGLSPDTAYGYRIAWPGYQGEELRFRTLPAANAARFRIVAYGDSRSDPAIHAKIADLILAQRPALVLNTGDLVADGTKTEEWKPMFFDPAARLMRSVPLFTVLGNHERNAENYYRYVSLPGNEACYSFDCGVAHFVALDPYQPYGEGSPQYQWLEQDLASVQEANRWIIAVFHEPMYSVHPTREVNGDRWAWERLFERHAVDLTLSGHDHYYARSCAVGPVRPVAAGARLAPGARYGTVHVVAGGGGAGLYPVAPQPYAACKKSVHHLVVLDFDGAAIQGQALDLDGNVIDRFALRRGQPQPADEYCAYEPMLWGHVAETAAPQLQAGPQGEVAGEGTIVARSPFPMRVAGELAWQAPPGWEIAGEPQRFSAEPGGELKLQFRVKGTWAKDRPLPTVTVRLTEADGGFDFVNREFTVRPFSVKAP